MYTHNHTHINTDTQTHTRSHTHILRKAHTTFHVFFSQDICLYLSLSLFISPTLCSDKLLQLQIVILSLGYNLSYSLVSGDFLILIPTCVYAHGHENVWWVRGGIGGLRLAYVEVTHKGSIWQENDRIVVWFLPGSPSSTLDTLRKSLCPH